jgi:hypothetical protein
MVRGLDLFRGRFRDFEGSFTLIGGAACDDWFTSQGLSFRATKDLDIVLLVEVIDRRFVTAFRGFVEEGGYEIRKRTEGSPVLYRFEKPAKPEFPEKLELFGRHREAFELAEGQTIIPVEVEPDYHSLSAILLDEAYYGLINAHQEERDGLRFATVTALIPLKARAWLDLTARRDQGEKIDSKDIDKHRTDVFRLAATLPGEPGPALAGSILSDVSGFLEAFPMESEQWPRILAALKEIFGGGLRPTQLRAAIQTYFRLPSEQ